MDLHPVEHKEDRENGKYVVEFDVQLKVLFIFFTD